MVVTKITSIRSYLLQDLDMIEKMSYKNYIGGEKDDTVWMEKVLARRENIILENPECDCGSPINISENGKCKCSNNHDCCENILTIIENTKIA